MRTSTTGVADSAQPRPAQPNLPAGATAARRGDKSAPLGKTVPPVCVSIRARPYQHASRYRLLAEEGEGNRSSLGAEVRAQESRSRFESLEKDTKTFVPASKMMDFPRSGQSGSCCCKPLPAWSVLTLSWLPLILLYIVGMEVNVNVVPARSFRPSGTGGHADVMRVLAGTAAARCRPEEAGALFFDARESAFVGCDGRAWSRLAFCCSPDQPDPPSLALPVDRADGQSLLASWQQPKPNGSPVNAYTLYVSQREPSGVLSGVAADYLSARHLLDEEAVAVACSTSGADLGCVVRGLDRSLTHWLTLVAHSPGGSSAHSRPAVLLPAPAALSLEVEDNGDCSWGTQDRLRLRLSGATNLARELMDGESALCCFNSTAVAQLLQFTPQLGALRAEWSADADELIISLDRSVPQPLPLPEPYLEHLSVRIKPSGRLLVASPAISLPANSSAALARVHNCYHDGFEGGLHWYRESSDVDAYRVSLDTSVLHGGRFSLRLEGGRGGQFDGLLMDLPSEAGLPKNISCWLRTESVANVGYLTIGGPSLMESVIFFHLRSDGVAGLLSANGYFRGRKIKPSTWTSVSIALDWDRLVASLFLDGSLAAKDVPFVSNAWSTQTLHLFNVDAATVWWDDLVVKYS